MPKPKNKSVRAWPKVDNILLCGLRCDNLVLKPVPGPKCANEDVGLLRGVDCSVPHRLGERILYALYVHVHLPLQDVLWELTGSGSNKNFEVK